jgi:hypothetical protein
VKRKLLLPHQSLFTQAPFLYPEKRFHFLVGGYGCGKTSSLASAWQKIAYTVNGKVDKEGRGPRILLGGINLGHLEKTTLNYILTDLDNSGTKYTYNKKDNRLFVGNTMTILTSLSEPQRIAGYDVVAALCDEIDDLQGADPDGTTYEAVRAVNERTRQRVRGYRTPFIMFGSTSQGQRGLYRVYNNFKGSGVGFTLVRGRTADNHHLEKSYVDSMYRVFTPAERAVYLEGQFIALAAGRVFGDFDWARNYANVPMDTEIHPGERIYWAQDFNQGYHRGCAAVLREGIIFIVKRYEFPDIREAPKVLRYDFPHNDIWWIPDTTAKDEIHQFTNELFNYRIKWITRTKNPNVEDTAFLVNKLLYSGRLICTQMAKETATALASFSRDKNNQIPKGVGPMSFAHDCDGPRYLCHYLALNEPSLRDIARITLYRHLQHEVDAGKESLIVDLGHGYTAIDHRAWRRAG